MNVPLVKFMHPVFTHMPGEKVSVFMDDLGLHCL